MVIAIIGVLVGLGRLVEGDQPVADAEVSFSSKSGPKSTGLTNSDGAFKLLLPDGSEAALVVFMILGQCAGMAACIAIDDRVAVQDVAYGKTAVISP